MSNQSNKLTLLSKKGMKELRKSVVQLEHNRQRAITSLKLLDKTNDRDNRLKRTELVFTIEGIEAEIANKKMILSTAQLIPRRSNLRVAIGSIVDLIDTHGQLFRYKIVDTVEANPSDGRISNQSPLGKSLVGKTIRDVVEWGNGMRRKHFQLIRIL